MTTSGHFSIQSIHFCSDKMGLFFFWFFVVVFFFVVFVCVCVCVCVCGGVIFKLLCSIQNSVIMKHVIKMLLFVFR